ncbi:hypothetical protein BH10ACT1_BH10ACT1_26430 [soil metagenome]
MRHLLRATLVGLGLTLVAAGCSGSGGGEDRDSEGARDRAVEVLRDFGLTAEQAACITDDLGAETIVEASDVQALTEGQAYRDAAEDCIS